MLFFEKSEQVYAFCYKLTEVSIYRNWFFVVIYQWSELLLDYSRQLDESIMLMIFLESIQWFFGRWWTISGFRKFFDGILLAVTGRSIWSLFCGNIKCNDLYSFLVKMHLSMLSLILFFRRLSSLFFWFQIFGLRHSRGCEYSECNFDLERWIKLHFFFLEKKCLFSKISLGNLTNSTYSP